MNPRERRPFSVLTEKKFFQGSLEYLKTDSPAGRAPPPQKRFRL